MISGIAVAATALSPDIEIIGIQSALYPSMYRVLQGIDPGRDAVTATIHVGKRPYAVAATPQATWVAVLGQPVMMHTPAPRSATGTLRWLLPLCR